MDKTTNQPSGFQIEGQVHLEGADRIPGDLKLQAYAFDQQGNLLGSSDVDANGSYSVPLKLDRPQAVELIIAPDDDIETVKRGTTFGQSFSEKDWLAEKDKYRLRPDLFVPNPIWWLWRPRRICISGYVRKQMPDGSTCPVPFATVKLYDVDRETCWWDYIVRWYDVLKYRPVIRIPELIEKVPPIPGPGPVERAQNLRLSPGEAVMLNPQPLPPGEGVMLRPQPLPPRELLESGPGLSGMMQRKQLNWLNPQPEPPSEKTMLKNAAFMPEMAAGTLVGEMRALSAEVAAPLSKLTLTSRLAPWLIFPWCWYSTQEVCETRTDCDGFYRCCFTWYPWHFRRGRLRFDFLPDIIVRVSQVINGVDTTVYADPYTSTRWNMGSGTIDITVDDPEVVCGTGCKPPPPPGSPTFFTLVGLDEVYKINQATGTFAGGGLANCAYGDWLLFCGLFGAALSTGAPKRYYRLSFSSDGINFTNFSYPMSDTRVNKLTFASDTYALGPQVVGTTPGLYEVRNMNDYYWYNPDKLAWWNTLANEADQNLYTVRLEVFDQAGNKLNTPAVDYRDGTVPPPGPLPPTGQNWCDLKVLVDNRYPVLDLQVPAASPDCGVIPWASVPFTMSVSVSQPHNHLYSYALTWVKGLGSASGTLVSAQNGSGLPALVAQPVSSAPMTGGLTGTCAFALTLGAWPLVRNGFSMVHYAEIQQAIAVEKCPDCPPPPPRLA